RGAEDRRAKMNRREFIGFGAACAAIVGGGSLAFTRSKTPSPVIALADPRYEVSLNFAQATTQAGGEVLEIAPDIGTLWFGEIELRLKRGTLRLAGLTLP